SATKSNLTSGLTKTIQLVTDSQTLTPDEKSVILQFVANQVQVATKDGQITGGEINSVLNVIANQTTNLIQFASGTNTIAADLQNAVNTSSNTVTTLKKQYGSP